MEVEKITVKVECGPWAVQAVAVLTDREGRTKEGAAGAAAALCRELQVAIQDGVDAGGLMPALTAPGASDSYGDGREPIVPDWRTRPGPRAIPGHFCLEHEVEFTLQSNERGTWYSHQIAGGGWCKERRC